MDNNNKGYTPPEYKNFAVVEPTEKIDRPFYKKWWFWLIVGLLVIIIVGSSGDKNDKVDTDVTETQVVTEAETQKETETETEVKTEKD